MKTLIISATVMCGLLLFLPNSVDRKGNPNQAKPTPNQVGTEKITEPATPQQMATAILAAVKTYRPMDPYAASKVKLTDSEFELLVASMKRALDTVEAVSGESFGGADKFQVVKVYQGWVLSRAKLPLTSDALAHYEARFKRIDSAAVQSWQQAKSKLDVGPDQRTLLILAIGFHNDLWDGAVWRQGNPTQAIERLQSVTQEATNSLGDAAGLPSSLKFVAAYALLGVDSLFVKNVFQPARFESALPLVRQMVTK